MEDKAYNQQRVQPEMYTDEKGRRRVDRDGTHQADKPLEPKELQAKVLKLEKDLAKANADLEKLKNDFSSMKIMGPGFSGSAGSGIKFAPNLTGSINCDTGTVTFTMF